MVYYFLSHPGYVIMCKDRI